MKTLLLLRHGKSSWDAGSLPDRERPLAPRGVKAARRMGRYLERVGPAPDRILCSPAVRTTETLRQAADAAGWRVSAAVVPELYGASPGGVLACVRAIDRDVETLLVVGHEPACSGAASILIGGAALRFPTAALACVRVDAGGWHEVRPGRGELLWFVVPRMLARLDAQPAGGYPNDNR